MRNICAIIPCRYDSSRLPGKALLEINGKSIIQRTYEQVCKSKYINKVYIACDGAKIAEHINSFSERSCIIISEKCLNGTERICYSLEYIPDEYDIIVNIQGDEPFINPDHIDLMIEKYIKNINETYMVCTTIHTEIKNNADIYNRNVGKMIIGQNNNIIYASRSMIPHTKSGLKNTNTKYQSHIGAYVFRRDFLQSYLDIPDTPAQLSEDIEWLKIIESGFIIKSYPVLSAEIGVNTQEDYNILVQKYKTSIFTHTCNNL
jgi:3-deoxy-manno-octulosonate cytidylyltransferase (CMP-KDO synthetase)